MIEPVKAVTLKDVAQACGVSVGTVSRALNDKSEVSAKTSDKIRQKAVEMGYIPNRAGQALSAHNSISYIGIMLPSINNPFFDDIKRGVSEATGELRDLGFDVLLEEEEGWNPKRHIEAIERLESRGCKAFGLCTVDDTDMRAKISDLTSKDCPVLLINNDMPDSGRICYVGPDYYKSGQIAAAMLEKCQQGIQLNLLLVVGHMRHQGHQSRIKGFMAELEHRGRQFQILDVIEGHDRDIDTQQAAMKALQSHPEINCIYMASGSGVSGLGAAIIAEPQHHRFVVACDEIYTTRELVKNDIVDFVVCQEPATQGYQAIKKLQLCLSRKRDAQISDYLVDNIIKIKNHFTP